MSENNFQVFQVSIPVGAVIGLNFFIKKFLVFLSLLTQNSAFLKDQTNAFLPSLCCFLT